MNIKYIRNVRKIRIQGIAHMLLVERLELLLPYLIAVKINFHLRKGT